MPQSFAIANHDRTLAVEFHRHNDRWAHEIRIRAEEGQSQSLVATSIEGTVSDHWPPSPPLQEISQEHVNGRPALMGVGMAGRSHWSLSVSQADLNNGQQALLFDWACLANDPNSVQQLGSQYSFEMKPTVKLRDLDRTLLDFDGIKVEVRGVSGQDGSTRVSISDGRLEIWPVKQSSKSTISSRWGYFLLRPN